MMMIIFVIAILLLYMLMEDNICDCNTTNNITQCSNCGGSIEQKFNYCPTCKEKLKKECSNCGSMININWRNCPYCHQLHKHINLEEGRYKL